MYCFKGLKGIWHFFLSLLELPFPFAPAFRGETKPRGRIKNYFLISSPIFFFACGVENDSCGFSFPPFFKKRRKLHFLSHLFPPFLLRERFSVSLLFLGKESKVSASVYYLNGRLGDREGGRGEEIRPFEIGEWVRRVENFRETAAGAASFFWKKRCFCVWAAIGLRDQKNSGKGKEICQVFSFPSFRRCEFDTGDIFSLTATAVKARKNYVQLRETWGKVCTAEQMFLSGLAGRISDWHQRMLLLGGGIGRINCQPWGGQTTKSIREYRQDATVVFPNE